MASCELIDAKSLYRSYFMDLSILSDFDTEDLEEMMDLSKKYTGEGSYYEPVPVDEENYENKDFIVRDLCEGYEQLSTSNSNAFSWAPAVITAAETSLRQAGIQEELSLPYLEKCLAENMEIENRNVTDVTIQQFLQIYGLMTKDVYNYIDKDIMCKENSANYIFTGDSLNDINKSGLMNMIHQGNPVISLMALNLVALKTVREDVEHNFRGTAYNPSVYGVVYGYSMNNFWSVSMHIVPCENVRLHLPMTESETDANYAGIAGFAFSVKVNNACPSGSIPLHIIMNYHDNPTTQSFAMYRPTIEASKVEIFSVKGQDGIHQTYNRVCVPPSYYYITLSDTELNSWPEGANMTIIFGNLHSTLTITSGKKYEALIHPIEGISDISKISSCEEFDLLDKSKVTYITFPTRDECTSYVPTEVDLSGFTKLEAFETSTYNFKKVTSVKANGLQNLEYLTFGYGAFQGDSVNKDGSFSVTDCPNLKEIYVEERAFMYYNSFTLSNLPSLEILKIGEPGVYSNCFYNAALVLDGILLSLENHLYRFTLSSINNYRKWGFSRYRRLNN